jgi:hypothetical protein
MDNRRIAISCASVQITCCDFRAYPCSLGFICVFLGFFVLEAELDL